MNDLSTFVPTVTLVLVLLVLAVLCQQYPLLAWLLAEAGGLCTLHQKQ